MTINLDIDYIGLAAHTHTNEHDLRHLLHSDIAYVIKHLKSNADYFPNARIIESDKLKEGENFEIFLHGLRSNTEESFYKINKQLKTMSAILDNIKAANEALHEEVVSVGNRVSGSLADLNAKISSMQDQIAAGSQPSAEDLNEAAAIVAQAQQDAQALSNIDPAPAATGTNDVPAEQPAS